MGSLVDLTTIRTAVPRLSNVVDSEVTRLIAEASDVIESYCNRTFGSQTFTEVHNTTNDGNIFLKQRPIISITSITIGLPENPKVLDPSTYNFDPNTGEVRGTNQDDFFTTDLLLPGLTYPFGYGWQSIQVIYVASFGTIPPSVAGRCIAMLNRLASQLAYNPALKAIAMVNDKIEYVPISPALNDGDKGVLSKYKKWALR